MAETPLTTGQVRVAVVGAGDVGLTPAQGDETPQTADVG